MEENNESNMSEQVNETYEPGINGVKNLNCGGNIHLKMCAICALAAFLGSFTAMYFVTDRLFIRKYERQMFERPPVEERFFDEFAGREMRNFDRMFFKDDFRPGIKRGGINFGDFTVSPVKLKTEADDEKFNVIIGLKPFQNNADAVNYSATKGKLTVFGKSDSKNKNVNTHVSFSQDFLLPDNADINGISKVQRGNKLIISVPLNK